MNRIDGFKNEELMLNVRTKFLNPLIDKVERDLEPRVTSLENDIKETIKEVEVDVASGGLVFHKTHAANQFVDITPLIPDYKGLGVENTENVGVSSGVEMLKLKDAEVVATGQKIATVSYDWDKLVKTNQSFTKAKLGDNLPEEVRQIRLTGYLKGTTITDQSLNVEIPEPTREILGQIGTGAESTIKKVQLVGNTNGSTFDGDVLKIHLPNEGGGGGISNQNFKGFFASLGDIESQVTDPINGMSYAFAKDNQLGGKYYTPYFYVNNAWAELKEDPALTYSAPSDPTNHGVFSIKPDARITVDANGQLDLSNLGIDETKVNFHGFFETQGDLEQAVTHPILEKSFAYIRHTNGAWIGKTYRTLQSGNGWQIVAPISAISLVKSFGTSETPKPLYGFYQNGMIEIDSNGLATIKSKTDQTIKINVLDSDGVFKTEDVTDLQFMNGESYVTLQNKKAYIQHPQRVMEYDSEFEQDHNSNNYMGNIFYDKTSRCWMGWSIPEAPGGVGLKWTRIAHEGMSHEVKDLLKRYPQKAPNVVSGTYGDAPQWEYTSWTYVDKDDSSLPSDFGTRCGAYFITIIQDISNDDPRPKERMQICYADEEGGHTYIRRTNSSAGDTDPVWHPWVRTNLTLKDISDHDTDPGAHKDHNKFYKVFTLDNLYTDLKSKNYFLKDKDLLLVADSHGDSKAGEDTISIPYTGKFKFSGRITFAGLDGTAIDSQWLLKVIKVKGGTNTTIAEFSYNHTTNPKTYIPPIKWASGGISLNHGDKIMFSVQCVGDGPVITNYPYLAFIPMRSYFVMEDATTASGSRIAEMHRRTAGTLSSRGNTGINIHYSNIGSASGAIRMYGTPIVNEFKDMTKVS